MEYQEHCEECGFCEDSAEPMMNYAYPLETEPKEEDILRIVQETNCTVMYNDKTGEHFLALCGGGMDLSQDIAMAYIIAECWIPIEFIHAISSQRKLSQSSKNFDIIKEKVIEQSKMEIERFKENIEKWSKK